MTTDAPLPPIQRSALSTVRALGAAASPIPPAAVELMVIQAARMAGVDEEWARRIAFCESSFNPRAVGPAGERGVFQFMEATWASNAPRFGYSPEWDRAFDAEANIVVAISMLARGEVSHWATCA